MRRPVSIIALVFFAWVAAYTVEVGHGAPTAAIQASFRNAYNRGLFSLLVNDPTADVRPLGSP
ncbi:MAG TPA: hypothetical protein VNH18_36085, partial [Bryobacteraceae bacterium]|nr:hypothetical protein [Bryobacteraceae bacterium]